jgi:hypothetical protein
MIPTKVFPVAAPSSTAGLSSETCDGCSVEDPRTAKATVPPAIRIVNPSAAANVIAIQNASRASQEGCFFTVPPILESEALRLQHFLSRKVRLLSYAN